MPKTQPRIESFFDPHSNTITHLVIDTETGQCCAIDPVLDFDAAAIRTAKETAGRLIAFIERECLELVWILETHAHADHLSAAHLLKTKLGGKTGIGANITYVQEVFADILHLDSTFSKDGSQFDHLFDDGEIFQVGNLELKVLATPGHTPACVTYLVGAHAFVGDTLFMPDYGTARCDFPGGDAEALYNSIQKLFSLPEKTTLHMCHDYMPGDRDPRWQCSVAEARDTNIHLAGKVGRDSFVSMRNSRDVTLKVPALLVPSIQVNIRAGAMPRSEENGIVYLKYPLNVL